jgi:hypothetical protein
MGINSRCYWECLEEQLGNMMRTHWEQGIVWFILISAWVYYRTHPLFFARSNIDWPTTNRSAYLDPSCQKKRNKCVPMWLTFSVYIRESWTLGKPYGIKTKVLLGTSWGTTWRTDWEKGGKKTSPQLGIPLGNILRTWWEPIENLKGTCWEQRKNEKPSAPPKLLVIVI